MEVAEKKNDLPESEIVAKVRFRYRVCHYLFNLAGLWLLAGYVGLGLSRVEDMRILFTVVMVTGVGIFTVAMALSYAVYRCPACDKFIRRFRPSKEHCGACGAKIR